MRDIFVVNSYASSPERMHLLVSTVDFLTKANRDICLVSHLPISGQLITPNVKFTIFDSRNILVPLTMTVTLRQTDTVRHEVLEIQYNPAPSYHGVAVYSNLYNALKILAGRYEWVHFIESDLETENIQRHLDDGFAPLKDRRDLCVICYPFNHNHPTSQPTTILTNIFSIRPEIVEFLPLVSSSDDYLSLGGGKRMLLEEWLARQLDVKKISYALVRGARMANKANLDGDYTIIKCRQHNTLYAVFLYNRTFGEIELKTNAGGCYRIGPDSIGGIENLSASEEIVVSFVGTAKTFRHPLEMMRLGAFRKNGVRCCPDWIDEATKHLNVM